MYQLLYLFGLFFFLDEIIRQITLHCAEQGYMLIQIRDEINMTIDAYQGLYESTIAYGIRKKLLVSSFFLFLPFDSHSENNTMYG